MDERFEDQRLDETLEEDKREEKTPEQETIERMQEALQEIRDGRNPEPDKEPDRDRKVDPEKTEELAKVLYQKQGAVYLPDERAETSMRTIMAGAVALREATDGQLSFSRDAIEAARHTSVDTFRTSLETVIRTWNEERGNQYDMNGSVMYKNFPDSVYQMSDFELRVNQVIGYMADGWQLYSGENLREEIKFDGDKLDRGEMKESVKTEELKLGRDADYNQYVRNLIGGKATLSQDEREIVSNALKFQEPRDVIPREIPQKDNLVFLAREAMDRGISADKLPLKNATDAMRLAQALNRYDKEAEARKEELRTKSPWERRMASRHPEKEKTSETGYYKLTNREKVFVYSILDKDKNILANMKGKEPEFKALARGLNGVRNAERRFPEATRALNMVRNNERLPQTRIGEVNALRDQGEIGRAAELLKTRPGEFARQMDSLLRDAPTKDMRAQVIRSFEDVRDKIPTRTLFTLREHFVQRQDGEQIKQIPDKGTGYLRQVTVNVPSIDKDTKDRTIEAINRGLQEQLREREPMGKVYVDPRYKNIPMPKDTKDETKTDRPISRGTKFDIPRDVQCLRVFKYSEGSNGFMDVSAAVYDKDLKMDKDNSINWQQLRSDVGVHSGDQYTAYSGVSEFIDVDLDKLEREHPQGYVAFELHAWSSGGMDSGTVMFGFMPREAPSSGEIYEPSTVETAYELRTSASATIPMIYDIENRQMIWADRDVRPDFDNRYGVINNSSSLTIHSTERNAGNEIYNVLHRENPSMYDVLTANAEARGELVSDPREADIVFGMDRMSDDVRAEYGLDREIEVPREDGTVEIQTTTAEYHDMYDRAVWTSKYM